MAFLLSAPIFCVDEKEALTSEKDSQEVSLKEERSKLCATDITKSLGYGIIGIGSLIIIGLGLKYGIYDALMKSNKENVVINRYTVGKMDMNTSKVQELLKKARSIDFNTKWIFRPGALVIASCLAYFNYEKGIFKKAIEPLKCTPK